MRHPEHVPGTKDYMGAEAAQLLRIAEVCAATFELYGYEPMVLPVFERADIFLQRSGEEIRSRMYILRDPKGSEICLRPEMTISAARAFLERMSARRLPVRLCYQGDIFRYDRIREGRYRQFLQAGVECIGVENRIAADIEAVMLALEAVRKAGVTDFRLLLADLELATEFIKSLPAPQSVRTRLLENFWRREAFDHLLKRLAGSTPQSQTGQDSVPQELAEILSTLGENASQLLVRQILSLFVEKSIGQRDLDEIAERFLQRFTRGEGLRLPQDCFEAMREYLNIKAEPDASLQRYEKLLQKIGATPGPAFESLQRRVEWLKKEGVMPPTVQLDLGFRRGIEYYTGFIFEIHCDQLGSVSQICGGGRYDRLLSALGSPRPLPAVGFAIGVDRLLLAHDASGASPESTRGASVDAVLTTVGQVDEDIIFKIAQICRAAGWRVRAEFDQRRLGNVLSHVSEEQIPFVIIAGEDELRENSVRVRDMGRHAEKMVAIDQLDRYVRATKDQTASNVNEGSATKKPASADSTTLQEISP